MKARNGTDLKVAQVRCAIYTRKSTLARGYHTAGQFSKALPLFETALERMKAKLGPTHPSTLTCMNSLALARQAAGHRTGADALWLERYQLQKTQLGADHAATLKTMNAMASDWEYAGHFEKAEAFRREIAAIVKTKSGADSAPYAAALVTLAMNQLQQSKWADAETSCRECLAIRKKIATDSWSTFNTESMLGQALAGQKKFSDAEPLLLSGFEGMKKPEAQIPPGTNRLREGMERLVDFYTATNQPAKAAEWRAKQPKEFAPPPRKKIEFTPLTIDEVWKRIEAKK